MMIKDHSMPDGRVLREIVRCDDTLTNNLHGDVTVRRTTGVQSTPRTTGTNFSAVPGRSTVHGGAR